MAKLLGLNIAATGTDTVHITANSNISNYLELVTSGIEVDNVDGKNLTLPASMAATDFYPTLPGSPASIYAVAVFSYNAAEATPQVDIDVDGIGVVQAGHVWGGIVTASLEIATPDVVNPVNMQLLYYTLA